MKNESYSPKLLDAAWNSFEYNVVSALNQLSEHINPLETEEASEKIRKKMEYVFNYSSLENVEEWESYGSGTVLKELEGYYIESKIDAVNYNVGDESDYYLYLIIKYESTEADNNKFIEADNHESTEADNSESTIEVHRLKYSFDMHKGFCRYIGETDYSAEELIKELGSKHPLTQFYNKITKKTD